MIAGKGHLSVSTSTIAIFLEINFKELRSEGFHSFTSSRPSIKASDDSTHSPCLEHRLQHRDLKQLKNDIQ